MTELNDILMRAQEAFVWTRSDAPYTVPEVWELPDPLEGESDVFVMYCNAQLRKRGIKGYPIYCQTEEGRGHMILGTDEGIFDNRQNEIVTMGALLAQGYSDFYTPMGAITNPWKEIKNG